VGRPVGLPDDGGQPFLSRPMAGSAALAGEGGLVGADGPGESSKAGLSQLLPVRRRKRDRLLQPVEKAQPERSGSGARSRCPHGPDRSLAGIRHGLVYGSGQRDPILPPRQLGARGEGDLEPRRETVRDGFRGAHRDAGDPFPARGSPAAGGVPERLTPSAARDPQGILPKGRRDGGRAVLLRHPARRDGKLRGVAPRSGQHRDISAGIRSATCFQSRSCRCGT